MFFPGVSGGSSGSQRQQRSNCKQPQTQVVRALKRHWPLAWCFAFIANFIWEYLGSSDKFELVALACVYSIVHYGAVLIEKWFPQVAKLRIVRRADLVAIPLIVLALSFPIHASFRSLKMRHDKRSFEYRVEAFLEHMHRLYNSPYMPEFLYMNLKRVFNRPYHPELRDQTRSYSSIDVTCYHLGTTGVKKAVYSGDSYGADELPPFHFVNLAEASNLSERRNVLIESYPEGIELDFRVKDHLNNFHGSAFLGRVELPREFSFCHWFFAPHSMTSRWEGFVLDFRNIMHPPKSIEVTFVTDRETRNEQVIRSQRNWALYGWLTGQPYYRQDDPEMAFNLAPVSDTKTVESFADELRSDRLGHTHECDSLLVFRAKLICRGYGEAYIVRYIVDDYGDP